MAIDTFVKGKTYIFEDYDLGFDFFIPFSYAKIYYENGNNIVINKYSYMQYRNNDRRLKICENYTNDNIIIYNMLEDVNIIKIEFKYDYLDNSIEKTITNALKPFCSLVGKRPLVSVYNAHNSMWVDLPCPSNYTGTSTTLVDSARNTQGQVIGQVIASDIAKVEMKWNFLTPQEYSDIAKLFEQKYNGSFFNAVSFFDTVANDWDGNNTITPTGKSGNNPCRVFYCGDRKVQFAKMVLNDDGTPKGYSGVSLNLIDTAKYYGE